MTDKQTQKTDAEIEKALECCTDNICGDCKNCPYNEAENLMCITQLAIDTIAYIKRLKEENEELKVAEQCLNTLHKAFCTEGDEEE